MTQKRSGPNRLGTPTLTASDWAEAALSLIAEQGLSALTVSTLAKRLGVTKGSFYWHFRGRDELLDAALTRWEQRTTTETMRALDAITDDRRRLEVMLTAAAQLPRSRSLYAALAVAAEDPIVRAVLDWVASMRITYLETCYRNLGVPAAEDISKLRDDVDRLVLFIGDRKHITEDDVMEVSAEHHTIDDEWAVTTGLG